MDLHADGWTALDACPEWRVCEFCNWMHDRWLAVVLEVLESLGDTWDESSGGGRPGEATAAAANDILSKKGVPVWLSTTHPSVCSEYPFDIDGPRWYCSIISAALHTAGGCCDTDGHAPRPPFEIQQLLWPEATEGARPWITELGWTLVPSDSDAQMLHADIVSVGRVRHLRNQLVHGRYHHITWKAPSSQSRLSTTEFAAGFFTNGARRERSYEELTSKPSPCLVLDSEVLHRGARTPGPPGTWSSTCTVQLCSTSGWRDLFEGSRCTPELAKYVIPIVPAPPMSPPASLAADSEGAKAARARHVYFDEGGAPIVVEPTTRSSSPTAVVDEDWAAIAAAHTASAAREWVDRAPRADDVASSLRAPGWSALPHGLPAAWAWEVFALVEVLHERFAAEISALLAAQLRDDDDDDDERGRHSRKRTREAPASTRPGERAAAAVTAALHERGLAISVYAGPPSQSQSPPYGYSGPRFYISVTQLAIEVYGAQAPPMPPLLRCALWPHAPEAEGAARVRGLGWALAPPGAPPQTLHADIWATSARPMPRFPHVLWKRGFATLATTQLVPSGFTHGAIADEHYSRLVQAAAPALVFDSEILHRGAPTPTPAAAAADEAAAGAGDGWVSSCSVELCSAAGWEEWQACSTGGTVFSDEPEYRMLPIAVSPLRVGVAPEA